MPCTEILNTLPQYQYIHYSLNNLKTLSHCPFDGSRTPFASNTRKYPSNTLITSLRISFQSSFGTCSIGNPLGCAVAIAALDVLVDEKLPERAARLGEIFKSDLETLKKVGANENGQGGWVKAIRCKGLFSAIDIDSDKQAKVGRTAWDLCLLMASKGVLAKPTHENT